MSVPFGLGKGDSQYFKLEDYFAELLVLCFLSGLFQLWWVEMLWHDKARLQGSLLKGKYSV